jgi:hypothetical protein
MTEDEVLKSAYAMPLTSPAYPKPPFRFVNREFVIVTYRTDPAALARVIPAPLLPADPLVKYEFIKMPDSSGLGSYTESGQVIPVTYQGKPGGFTHAMYLDSEAGIASGRELLGFPNAWSYDSRCCRIKGNSRTSTPRSPRRSVRRVCARLWRGLARSAVVTGSFSTTTWRDSSPTPKLCTPTRVRAR